MESDNTDESVPYVGLSYPIKHRRKVPFNPVLRLNPRYRMLWQRIQELDRELGSFVLAGKDLIRLVEDAFASNIHSSVSMEGNPLSAVEVRRISTAFFRDHLMTDDVSGPQQEIINHLYSHFLKRQFSLPWDLKIIQTAHGFLMDGSGETIPMGKFRKDLSCIRGEDGFEYFHTCPPEHIEEEMQSLLDWLNGSPYDGLLTATLFLHEFESIHPFDDGNGRLGRSLFHVLLQEFGLRNSQLCKIEQSVLRDREKYYGLLGYVDKTGDYVPLVMHMAECTHAAYEEAVSSFREKDLLRDMDENDRTLVRKARDTGWFSLSDAGSWLPGISDNIVRKRLNALTDLGVLLKRGRTRATRYRFHDPLRMAEERVEGVRSLDEYTW